MSKKKSSENIRVVIRVRNLLENEIQRGDKQAVRLDLATQQIIVSETYGDPHTFAFDAVYNNTFAQRDIFIKEVQPLLESVLQGYNATVFAYGQSGSGKTHTMTGNLAERSLWGMMPQAVDHLFQEIKKFSSQNKTFKVKVSYVELYQAKARDLLATKQVNLEIKENMAKNFYVKGAETPEVTNFDECIRYFQLGTDRRQTASTNLNDQSSRSHSLFSMTIDQLDFENDPSSPILLTSKINIVDLAGSEKLSKTGATGETLKEGNDINLSLSALATVIDTIVKGGKHIPYRGNPLTMLLKDSLGGNAKTVMFANLGPSDKNTSESVSTLRFAMRAKQIKNKPIKNLDPKDAHIQELLEKIAALQKKLGDDYDPNEEETLQRRIEELEIENAELRGGPDNDRSELEEKIRHLQGQLQEYLDKSKEMEHELATVLQDKAISDNSHKAEMEYSKEIKSVCSNFIKRVLSQEQVKEIQNRMPSEYNHKNEGWELREIQFFLEGFLEIYEKWRLSSYTEEDVKHKIAKATEDSQQALQRQLEEVMRHRDELLRQNQEVIAKQSSEGAAQSQIKVELTALKEENAKLREKIERDQEKMKNKLEKMKEEAKVNRDDLANYKMKLDTANSDITKLKDLLQTTGASGTFRNDDGDEEKQHLRKLLEEATEDQNALKAKLMQTHVTLRRKGFCIKEKGNVFMTSVDASRDEANDDHNDAFILAQMDDEPVDGDMLGVLQQQIRVQHRLHELRHEHQKKLDLMLRKYERLKTGKVMPSSESGISDEEIQLKIKEALLAKEKELSHMHADSEKKLEKLVKKLNKKESEMKDFESTIVDEKVSLEEERNELIEQNDELQKLNQKLAVEVENLRKQLENSKYETDRVNRTAETEISHLKNDISQLIASMDEYKAKVDAFEALKAEHSRLQQQNYRAEQTIKENMAQLENNRQLITRSNSLLEKEKECAHELELQAKLRDEHLKEMEEGWRAQIVENANKLVAINNRRLEEQASEYQEILSNEREKQQAIVDKLRKAKSHTSKAQQRYDEMVLENEMLQLQLEELKVSTLKIYREKQEAQRDLDNFGKPATRQRGL